MSKGSIQSKLAQRMAANTQEHRARSVIAADEEPARFASIMVSQCVPGKYQPRLTIDDDGIEELARSIESAGGLIQPIVVRPIADDKYEIIAGERRWRAHKKRGWKLIDALIRDVDDSKVRLLSYKENADREDISDYENAKAILRMESDYPSRTALAKAVGMARPDMYRLFAFSALPSWMVEDLERKPSLLGRMSADLVKSLLEGEHGAVALEMLPELWNRVKEEKLSQAKLPHEIKKAIRNHEKASAPAQTLQPRRELVRADRTYGFVERKAGFLHVKLHEDAIPPEIQTLLEDYIEGLIDKAEKPVSEN